MVRCFISLVVEHPVRNRQSGVRISAVEGFVPRFFPTFQGKGFPEERVSRGKVFGVFPGKGFPGRRVSREKGFPGKEFPGKRVSRGKGFPEKGTNKGFPEKGLPEKSFPE